MQISLEQIIQIIMAKLDNIELSMEDMKFRTNVALRILREEGLLTQDRINKAIKDEFEANNILEDNDQEIEEEKIEEISKGILNWVDNDLEEMKNKIKDYQDKMKKMMDEEEKNNISVAPADLLNRLDSMNNNNKKGKSGNIIMP
ncbi:hypothetical protein OF820_01810 [Oceanotoga sp. DSM 15011]|jgi:hypothetical protein|uniref:Uncharacterized protein n=1 Tax=Oceanotoga teriensis TaxID=515440 RepID=A0AA45C5F9_9BACT|nr:MULTISPECIES: hypothetical protein [Oceanotoga]MDN5342292.1 hypothetical protein [Oceanotoga sp.]MDO7977355.1 hypothetical protein [Oceanotoga teriensis]PWJ88745.1 hypothetical protein C7380_11735 [Oceanotoga teriensis]UYP00428.1 hypothetical protein OF820_01810 [Oceanotoga sp. DSM 15011]